MTQGRLDRSSPLFWLTLTAAVGIIGLGARFLIAPQVGAEGFGVPLQDGNGLAFACAKGIRDIFSGLVGLPFLFVGRRRAVAWILLTASIIPVTDGFIMMKFSGLRPAFLAIHWGTALYIIVLATCLFRRRKVWPTNRYIPKSLDPQGQGVRARSPGPEEMGEKHG